MSLTAASAQSPTIMQSTQGWCSPVVGQAGGNVTIICQGVNPKALDRLNEFLRTQESLDKKYLELQTKIQEAETWTQRYRELQDRLTQEGQNDILSQTVKGLLDEGKLEAAGAILDSQLASGEKGVENVKTLQEFATLLRAFVDRVTATAAQEAVSAVYIRPRVSWINRRKGT